MTIVFALTLTAMSSLSASAYSDVASSDWFNDNVKAVSEAKIINGYEDGTFRPYGNVTYAEALKITSAVHANLTNNWAALENTTVIEDDYKDHWAGKYVTYAMNNGILSSKLPVRDFDKAMLRVALSEYIANALPDSLTTEINDFTNAPQQEVTEYVKKLYKNGIMVGDDKSFNLNQCVTRAELAAMSDRLMNPEKRVTTTATPTLAPTPAPTPAPQVANNTLTIKVSDDLLQYMRESGRGCEVEIVSGTPPCSQQTFKLTKDTYNSTTGNFTFTIKPLDFEIYNSLWFTSDDPVFKGIQINDKLIETENRIILDSTTPLNATLIGNVEDDTRVTLDMQDEVHDRIMKLKSKYPEGCKEPPCDGCNTFVEAVSDTIFRYQPTYAHYNVRDAKIGDLIYYFWTTKDGGYIGHWIVVTDVDSTGVIAAEGNYGGKAHWDRKYTFTELEKNANKVHLGNWDSSTIVLTRYLDTDTSNMRPLEYLPACEIEIENLYNHWWAKRNLN